jgi:CRISPR-associated protein Cas2
MFVIMVYDINTKRVNKVLKISRRYLHWVQNSVLEGELTSAQLTQMKAELSRILKKEEDSVIFYKFRTKAYYNREIIGVEKGGDDRII